MWNVEILDSSNEDVRKFVFKKDDAVAEAVLYKYPTYEDRTVMCISTQSGCPMGCTFCGTGKFFNRNLTQKEIVGQVLHMKREMDVCLTDVKNLQIMVMSMGEPVLNAGNVANAFRELQRIAPEAKLLISTSAPTNPRGWETIMQVAEEIPTVGLQFSIHESSDEPRNLLIPFPAKLTLEQIADKGMEFFARTGRHPFFNYCVHEGNSDIMDARRLFKLFDPSIWQATLSVICESDQDMSAAVAENAAMTKAFSDMLLVFGYSTRVFDPAGQDDIGGGCGQLWQVQEWARQNPELMKQSLGNKYVRLGG